jgi:hypothetical protein
MFLRNVGWLSTDYTALYPRRQNSSQPPLWEPQILLHWHERKRFFIRTAAQVCTLHDYIQFLSEKTLIQSESKAALVIHTFAMGYGATNMALTDKYCCRVGIRWGHLLLLRFSHCQILNTRSSHDCIKTSDVTSIKNFLSHHHISYVYKLITIFDFMCANVDFLFSYYRLYLTSISVILIPWPWKHHVTSMNCPTPCAVFFIPLSIVLISAVSHPQSTPFSSKWGTGYYEYIVTRKTG